MASREGLAGGPSREARQQMYTGASFTMLSGSIL